MHTAKHLAQPTESEITVCVVRALIKLLTLACAINVVVLVAVFGVPILGAVILAAVGLVALLALVAAGMDPAPAPKAKTYKLL